MIPKLLTIDDVANRLNRTPRGLWKMLLRGDGPETTRVGRLVYIREDRLSEWIDDNTGRHVEADEVPGGDAHDGAAEGGEMEPAPNHATAAYRARIAAQGAKAARERKAKGRLNALREQQRRAGGGGGSPELRPAAVSETQSEAARRLRAEQAGRG